MYRSSTRLTTYTVVPKTGESVDVTDLLFDDEDWTIRYIVVRTGALLFAKETLVSPMALCGLDPEEKKMHVKLTRVEIDNGPDIDVHRPISRQKELEYNSYFSWPSYWGGIGLWGNAAHPGLLVLDPELDGGSAPAAEAETHLRRAREVSGYRVIASDGVAGVLEDLLVEESTWKIEHLVVSVENGSDENKVLLDPGWIYSVDWAAETVEVDLPRQAIYSATEI